MEQHPIPQQISSYEFKLVGNMTLKQFGKLAVGVVLGLILFSSGLPFLIKWPLIFICVGGGAAIAFVPYQDRPLEMWISYLIKRIYSPTVYLYQKSSDPNWLDLDRSLSSKKEDEERVEMKSKGKVNEFISSLPEENDKEVKFGRVRFQKTKQELKVEEEEKRKERRRKMEAKAVEAVQDAPEEEGVKVEEVGAASEKARKEVGLGLKRKISQATADAHHSDIPMPKTPTIPNIIVGMVFDERAKIVENAIVEVQDMEGNPMRALRTNALGQFQTASPLRSGEYVIITEREGITFDIIKIKLIGEVVGPIRIKAKSEKILN